MPQIVEYNGQRIEFPDGMPPKEIEAAIRRSALSLPPNPKAPDPTEGMSGVDRFRAGMGKAFTDVARGVGQLVPEALGGVTRADVAESRKRDAPLMATGAGLGGDIFGNLAALLPTAFLPGAGTIPGAAVIGGVSGLLQPSERNGEPLQNTVIGGIAAPGAIAAGRGATALYQGGKALVEPLTKAGQERIAASVLQSSATDPAKAAAAAARARELVPGSTPTLAQVADDPGLAQLERTILNNPEYAGAVQSRLGDQRMARLGAIKDVAGRGDYYDDIVKGRAIFANEDYGNAMKAGVNQPMAEALQPQIESLLRRPSITQAKGVAQRLAAENDQSLTNFGTVEGLDWLKKALDNQISKARQPGSAIGDAELRALVQTKSDLMATLEQIAPAYKQANQNYAAMSQQVNSSEVARSLLDKLNKPGSRYATPGTAKEMGDAYSDALAKSFDSVKKSTGMDKGITDVMAPRDVKALEDVARDIARKQFAETAGRATGSNTAQNLASQNMLRRMLGPTGLPESWAESTMLQSMLYPVQGVSKLTGADKRVMDRIAASLLDPADAALLLTVPPQVSRGLLGAPAQRMLPGVSAGLLGVQLQQ